MSIISFTELKKRVNNLKFVFTTVKSIREHLEVVFVFGMASDDTLKSNRAKFLTYINAHRTPFNFITIEALYNDLKAYSSNKKGVTAQRIALVDLELRAIKQAHSLIIFPESAGSYAELGYFTAIEETKQKMYIANDYAYSDQESYLNHLIDVIHNTRTLRPLFLDFNHVGIPEDRFDRLIENLAKDYEANRQVHKFVNSLLFPLAITYELIRLLPFLTYTQLQIATEMILDTFSDIRYDTKDFTVNISMLVVSGLIIRQEVEENIYFLPVDENYEFISFSLSERDRVHLMALEIEYSEDKKRLRQ
ncbi:MAG: retron St85 family effector protein [Sulfuricurvum sp.]|nr:retron St85 family effector protein [Sulfuricurvum sp.]